MLRHTKQKAKLVGKNKSTTTHKHKLNKKRTISKTTTSVTSHIQFDGLIHNTTQRQFAARGGNGSGKSKALRSQKTVKKAVKKLIKTMPAHTSEGFSQGKTPTTAMKFIDIPGGDGIAGQTGDQIAEIANALDYHRQQQQTAALNSKDPLSHLRRSGQMNTGQGVQDPIIMNHGAPLTLNPDSNDGKPYFKYGLFKHIQLPPTPADIHQTIKKRVEQVQAAKGFTNPKERIKDHVLRRLNVGVQLFLHRIDASTNTLPPSLTFLHPFEFEIASLTLSAHSHDVPLFASGSSNAIQALKPRDSDLIKTQVKYHEKIVDNALTKNSPVFNGDIVDGFTPLREDGSIYYNTVLYNVQKCREHIVHHYHKYKKLINECDLPQDFHRVSREEVQDIERMITSPQFVQTFHLLRSMLSVLKTQHWIDPNIPTVVCVGAPNVGKSSIVRAVSTSKTPVQHYRFTTRRLTIGHMDVGGFTCQVTDSPGLLPRPDDKRNGMEALTLAALKHLPLCGVVFVIDPSVQGGVSLQHQLLLRNELRWRYGKVIGNKWVDVATKADIWKNTYGIRKNTMPLIEPERFADDPLTLALQKQYQDENDGVDISSLGPKQRAAAMKKQEKSLAITPRWNLPEALAELGEMPPGFKDIPLPSLPLSTIHLRGVHNEVANMHLRERFVRNKRQNAKLQSAAERKADRDRQRLAAGDESFGALPIIDIGETSSKKGEDEFDAFSLEDYEKWWDALPKGLQKQYMQATQDTDTLKIALESMLGVLIKRVETTQDQHQQQQVELRTNELEKDEQQHGRIDVLR